MGLGGDHLPPTRTGLWLRSLVVSSNHVISKDKIWCYNLDWRYNGSCFEQDPHTWWRGVKSPSSYRQLSPPQCGEPLPGPLGTPIPASWLAVPFWLSSRLTVWMPGRLKSWTIEQLSSWTVATDRWRVTTKQWALSVEPVTSGGNLHCRDTNCLLYLV
jgi:hypothetical protein